ncbi:hypothetical protein ANANG_G00029440 [Anguilla anguilla]|uniref:UBE2O N-terminal SH3-A domain-containing protein n=1 Tax=Anguilla anguilla TaxID=7936 RepID=A0A9D3S3S3_ANGAN|nr:hypothetical protein ANANG_G00029440 [Anguilla anguilla]
MAEPVASGVSATDAASSSPTPALSPAVSPGSEPPSMALSPSAGGSQRLLFSHDLVSGRYRGSVRFGLVRMIHGEEDFDSDSDLDGDGGGGGGGGGEVVVSLAALTPRVGRLTLGLGLSEEAMFGCSGTLKEESKTFGKRR